MSLSSKKNRSLQREWMTALASIGLVLAAVLACSGYEEIEPSEVCKEAGYSISNRTLTCTNDAELANGRYRRLMNEFQCIAKAPPPPAEPGQEPLPGASYEQQLACAQNIFDMTCEEVIAAGDNLGAYLAKDGCSLIFTNVGPDGGLDVATPSDVVCAPGTLDCTGTGQCVDTSSDIANCGACGFNCNTIDLGPVTNVHQAPVCENSACKLGCEPSHATCDADPTHVCLYSIFDDPTNCGGCGNVCPTGQTCVQVTAAFATCQLSWRVQASPLVTTVHFPVDRLSPRSRLARPPRGGSSCALGLVCPGFSVFRCSRWPAEVTTMTLRAERQERVARGARNPLVEPLDQQVLLGHRGALPVVALAALEPRGPQDRVGAQAPQVQRVLLVRQAQQVQQGQRVLRGRPVRQGRQEAQGQVARRARQARRAAR